MAKPGGREAETARRLLGGSEREQKEAVGWALLAIYEALTEGVTIGLDNLRRPGSVAAGTLRI